MANMDEKNKKRLNIFIAAAVFVVLGVVMAIGGNVIVQDGAMELQQDLELSSGAELHTDTICNALGLNCKSVSNLVDDSALWADTDGNATLASGSVGIGTAQPDAKLHIVGDVLISNNNFLNWLDSSGTPRDVLKMDSNDVVVIRNPVGDILLRSTDQGSNITFETRHAGLAERMRLTSDGKLGIGVTEPSTLLDVDGAIRTRPSASTACSASTEGTIYYNQNDRHFYGCNSTDWNRLD